MSLKSPTIVLGSTSPFRKEVLNKLNIAFETDKPNVDETEWENETAIQLVERLAIAKANAVAEKWQNALVIGSDQVALFNDQILGKPHTHENAVKQLSSFSGNKVTFLTGLAVTDTQTNKTLSLVEPFEVHFKQLSAEYDRMRDNVEESVESMSKKMNDVLNNYFTEVQNQTNERMREWNNQTSTFSSAMLDVTNELNTIISQIREENRSW